MEIYQILLLVFAVIVVGLFIYKRITGVDIIQKVALTKPVVCALAGAMEAASKLWPSNVLKIAHLVLKAAAESTELAEKAWKVGNLGKDERNMYAKKLTRETLEKAGIEVTPQIEMIISGMIEVVCMLLPHETKKLEESKDEVQK